MPSLLAGHPSAILLAKGTDQDCFWVDDDDKGIEVPEDHERAVPRNRSGMLKIEFLHDGGEKDTWDYHRHDD